MYASSICLAQDWSFSDVMFVTKKNMANAVATVSKQMENVSETLAVSRTILLNKTYVLDSNSIFWILCSILSSQSAMNLCSQQKGI